MTYRLRAVVVLCAVLCGLAAAQDEMPGGSREQFPTAALYRRLGSVGLDPTRVYRVREASLDREDLHLFLKDGVIAFTQTVDGRITGAFFAGEGELLLSPPDRVERWSLSIFTDAAILEERFTNAYLRFNDDTFAELEPSLRPFEPPPSLPEPEPNAEPEEKETAQAASPQEFVDKWDRAARALAQVGALRLLITFGDSEKTASGGSINWKPLPNDHLLFARVGGTRFGVFDVCFDSRAPEQIVVAQPKFVAGADYYDIWTSFPMRSVRQRIAEAGPDSPLRATVQTQAAAESYDDPITITNYRIRAAIKPPREVEAETTLELEATEPGHRVLVFELSRFLQVKEVTVDGRELEFVQNEAIEGSELARRGNDLIAVAFPKAIPPKQRVSVRFTYAGDVLSDAGGGLLYVGARGIWYPNRGMAMSKFDIEFRYPSSWTLVATGKRVTACAAGSPGCERAERRGGEPEDGPEQVAHYISERPIPLAGFNLGRYVKAEAKAGAVTVDAYASRDVETNFPKQQQAMVGTEVVDPYTGRRRTQVRVVPAPPLSPSQHAQAVADQTARTVGFLAARLGDFPYGTLAMTQIPGRNSQSWPGMVYLSSYAFLTPEERARTRVNAYEELMYSRLMAAHETAHQWWGDSLLWNSYREQWLVEALSNYCVLLMIEQQDPAAFRSIMETYRKQLLEETKYGRATGDAGPVTLGVRLNSSRFPDAYDQIAYGRGTWLFHMLRHMLLDNVQPAGRVGRAKTSAGEDPFFEVLRNLCQRFAGKEITTRDVQQAFEEALPDTLRYEGHKSLEWFFDGWVNGTAIPHLQLTGVKLTRRAGSVVATGRIVQKSVPGEFVSSLPLYAETGSGKPVLLGRVFAEGAETPFRIAVPENTRKLLLDPYATVLSRP